MFHLASAAGFGAPRGCPLGHCPLGPRPPRPCSAAPPGAPAGGPPPAPPPPPAGPPPARPPPPASRPRRSTRCTGGRSRSAPARVHRARRLDETAILYAAIHPRAIAPQLRFQFEVAGLPALPDQVDRAGRFLARGLYRNRAVLHMPQGHVAVPALQAAAIEHGSPSRVVGKIDWVRLREAGGAAPLGR